MTSPWQSIPLEIAKKDKAFQAMIDAAISSGVLLFRDPHTDHVMFHHLFLLSKKQLFKQATTDKAAMEYYIQKYSKLGKAIEKATK